MAQHYLGLNRGQLPIPGNIAVGTSTNSTDMELRWDDTKNLTRKDIDIFLEVLEQFLLSAALETGSTGTGVPPL